MKFFYQLIENFKLDDFFKLEARNLKRHILDY